MTAPAINYTSDMPLPKEVQQQDTMRFMLFTDVHGRRWGGVVSNKTLDPCTMLTPDGWKAPLPAMTPPPKYHVFDPNRVGFLSFDYDRWIVDISNAEREYGTFMLEIAKKEFGSAALQKIQSKDQGLRALCGPPPQSSEYVRAMKAGNKWALGIARPDGTAYPRPAWAEDYFDGWIVESTFDGGSVDLLVSADQYPDVDDEAAEIADRLTRSAQYADDEDSFDPTAQRVRAPIPRAKRKES